MTTLGNICPALAELLEYPGPDLVGTAERCRGALAAHCPEAARNVELFAAFAAGEDPRALEELYTRTFDLTPERTLDLGFQLFGESYKRGIFLVRIQQAVREAGIEIGHELADHLPLVLRLLARTADPVSARDLADEVILPAVARVLGAFGQVHDENPYRLLLEATRDFLAQHYDIREIRSVPGDEAQLSVRSGAKSLPIFPGFDAGVGGPRP